MEDGGFQFLNKGRKQQEVTGPENGAPNDSTGNKNLFFV